MSTDYFDDHHSFVTSQALPTPTETPYHTPSLSRSRRSSRHGTPSPGPPSSPLPPMPPGDRRGSTDAANDETISILDPRRFTPTLHANLVAEILNLRRELDSRNVFVENLETTLHATKEENEVLNEKLAQTAREQRSAKKQLQHLETGTLSALEELAKERDDVQKANDELKAKLEASQKRIRSQEDDSSRAHSLWEKDKDAWESERRLLERKVHITEGRLKAVVEELTVQHATDEIPEHPAESEDEQNMKDSGLGNESDSASVASLSRKGSVTRRYTRHRRNMSSLSRKSDQHKSFRFSVISGVGSESPGKGNGISLADELAFDEEDEDEDANVGVDEEEEEYSDDHETRLQKARESRLGHYQDEKAKRILGLTSAAKEQPVEVLEIDSGRLSQTDTLTESQPAAVIIIPTAPKPSYVDTAVQFSPPPSPKLPLEKKESVQPRSETPTTHTDVEANQRKKRTSALPPGHLVPRPSMETLPKMVSASCQTSDEPLSPPATPKIEQPEQAVLPLPQETDPSMTSMGTQTDLPDTDLEAKQVRRGPPEPIMVPSIEIHPPMSAPNSPRDAVLPPRTKSIGCQADMPRGPVRSVSVQTEEIKVDRRMLKLPAHLQPAAIRPAPSPQTPKELPISKNKIPYIGEPGPTMTLQEPMVLGLDRGISKSPAAMSSSSDIEDRYPGNNDNGPLSNTRDEGVRRPFRTSSLFAGFDIGSSDEEGDMSLDEAEAVLATGWSAKPMLAPAPTRFAKNGMPFSSPPTPVPEEKEPSPISNGVASTTVRRNGSPRRGSPTRQYKHSPRSSLEREPRVSKAKIAPKQSSILRSALIQSGTAAHLQHSRKLSDDSAASSNKPARGPSPQPPFPVPTRLSSRRIPLSKSEGSQSPTPHANGMFPRRGAPAVRGAHARKDSLRKVRSAAVIPRNTRVESRQRSRSPPFTASSMAPDSPQLPPLPRDDITSSKYGYTNNRSGHKSQPSTNTSNTGNGSVASSVQQTSVVDAIAATMVGEWMWKYVRGRKSFGAGESPQDFGKPGDDGQVNMAGNGVRHKRWVWLSPYERSIMWSSKQPTNGTALLGKSGRKLTIQSVLDVKDDTPMPKGSGAVVFNRSILILTPARALKFTTVSKERHYLWLTALSFLAHSSAGVPDLMNLSAAPPPEPEVARRQPTASLRRAPIRDSVRLAKNKRPTGSRSRTEPIHEIHSSAEDNGQILFDLDVVGDTAAADGPSIPRFSTHAPVHHHGRKRSATGPRIPPPSSSFRSYSSQHLQSAYSNSITTPTSDQYARSFHQPASMFAESSRRTSEASSQPVQHNFFDAVGTVRMEAFVEPTSPTYERGSYEMDPTFGGAARPRPRRRGNGYSGSTIDSHHRAGGVFDDGFMVGGFDPFKGF